MSMIRKRVERLESKGEITEPITEFVWCVIRPGDLKCIAEHRWRRSTNTWTVTKFPDDDEALS